MKLFKSLVSCSVAVCFSMVSLSAVTKDKTKPEDAIKYRQNLMHVVKGSAGSLGALLKNKVSFKEEAIPLAKTLAMSARQSIDAFKQDTRSFKNEDVYDGASPDIWKNWDAYVAEWKKLEVAANDMAKAIEKGDDKAIRKAAKIIGGSCKGCHDDYTVDE